MMTVSSRENPPNQPNKQKQKTETKPMQVPQTQSQHWENGSDLNIGPKLMILTSHFTICPKHL